MVKTGFVHVQSCTQASCASLQCVKTTHVETGPPVFPNLGQTSSASAPTGGLDSSAWTVRHLMIQPGAQAEEVKRTEVTQSSQGQLLTDQILQIVFLVLSKSVKTRLMT